MKEALTRVERLLRIESHAARRLEHFTFDRLVYRNRNQHRHGFYFRRLELVRKLLRQIRNHIVWNSLHKAVSPEKAQGPKKSQSKASLYFSTLTIDDLKSVDELLNNLVHYVIPNTSKIISTQLVARGHFLPFAVSVSACLARIRVQEEKLLSQVRGSLNELNVLFSVDTPIKESLPQVGAKYDQEEDVGECLDEEQELVPRNQDPGINRSPSTISQAINPHLVNSESTERRERSLSTEQIESLANDEEASQDYRRGESLYQVMLPNARQNRSYVVHMPRQSTIIELDKNQTGSREREVKPKNFQDFKHDETNKLLQSKRTCLISKPPSLNIKEKDEPPNVQIDGSNPSSEIQVQGVPVSQHKNNTVAESDSDDIDDIFGNLD